MGRPHGSPVPGAPGGAFGGSTSGRSLGGSASPPPFLTRGSGAPACDAPLSKSAYEAGPRPFARTAPAGTQRRPAVPLRSDAPLMGLSSDRDFIVSNAVDAVVAPVRGRIPRDPAVPEPKHAAYGRPPKYLERIKADARAEHEAIAERAEADAAASVTAARLHPMPAAEQQALVERVKARLAAANTSYAQLSFITDTLSKVARKEALERYISELEGFKARLQRPQLYIFEDV